MPKFLVTILMPLASSQAISDLLLRTDAGQRALEIRDATAPDGRQRRRRRALLARLPALAEIVEDHVDLLLVEVEEVLVAADHHRRVGARRQALFLDQRERAVGSGLPRLDAQAVLDMRQDAVRAAQHARHIGA